MTKHRITTQRERDEFSAGVRQREAINARLRDKPLLTPEDIRARIANPPEMAPVTGQPIPPSVKAEATEAFIEMAAARASDKPTILATDERVRAVENTWRATEEAVEGHFQKWPEHRWFDMLQPADDLLRKPADDAAKAFRFATAPGVPAIVATSRMSEPWVMHSPADFDHAIEAIAGDLHCDLQINGPVVIDRKRHASCVDWFGHCLAIVKRADGTNGQLEREFFEQNFVTVPVARGDLLILMRVCCWCLGKFLGDNAVDPTKCTVEQIYSDGFGTLPWKVIEPPATDESNDDHSPETRYDEDHDG